MGITIMVTLIGGGTLVGDTQEIFRNGIVMLLPILILIISNIILFVFVVPKFIGRFKGCLSTTGIIGRYYGKEASIFSAMIVTVFAIILLGAQIKAMGSVCNDMLSLDLDFCTLVLGIIVVLYSAFGGISSVIVTDVIQFVIVMIAIPVVTNLCLDEAGGLKMVFDSIPLSHKKIISHDIFLDLFFLTLFYLIPSSMLSPPLVQRLLMFNDLKSAQKSGYLYNIMFIMFLGMVVLIAFSILTIAPVLENTVIQYAITKIIPIGLQGIAICGAISVIMSTADSHLNAAAVIFTENFTPQRISQDSKRLKLMKINSLIIGFIAVYIAIQGASIFSMIVFAWILLSIVNIPFFMKVMGLEVTKKQFWVTTIFSMITAVIVMYILDYGTEVSSLIIVVSSFIFFTLTHLSENNWHFSMDKEVIRHKIYKKSFHIRFKEAVTFKSILSYATEKFKEIGAPYQLFGVVCLCYYIISFILWPVSSPNIVILRFISGILCTGLIFFHYFDKRIQKLLPLYWYVTILFTMPFVTTVTYLSTDLDASWLTNIALSLFFVGALVNWLTFILINVLGCVLGIIFYTNIIGDAGAISSHFGVMSHLLIFALIVSILFSRQREGTTTNRISDAYFFSSMMGHEVKEPLATCSSQVDSLMSILNRANISQESDKNNNGINFHLRDKQYGMLEDLKRDIQDNLVKGMQMINMCNMSSKEEMREEDKEVFSMGTLVKEAVEEMYLTDEERQSISIQIKLNFKSYGFKLYMRHVIWNIISNAFKHNTSSGDSLKLKIYVGAHFITLEDNGSGIGKEMLGKIFDRFVTSSSSGNGLGLSFCKLVLEEMGGSIKCESAEGKYARFTITLPEA